MFVGIPILSSNKERNMFLVIRVNRRLTTKSSFTEIFTSHCIYIQWLKSPPYEDLNTLIHQYSNFIAWEILHNLKLSCFFVNLGHPSIYECTSNTNGCIALTQLNAKPRPLQKMSVPWIGQQTKPQPVSLNTLKSPPFRKSTIGEWWRLPVTHWSWIFNVNERPSGWSWPGRSAYHHVNSKKGQVRLLNNLICFTFPCYLFAFPNSPVYFRSQPLHANIWR